MSAECSLVTLDRYERGAVLDALADKHNRLAAQGRPTDAIDDALVKVAKARPTKRRGGRNEAR
jgi:hypothetical protein